MDDCANLAVCWERDVEVADCVVVERAIGARFLCEGQPATGLLGCISNLRFNYTITEANNNSHGLSYIETMKSIEKCATRTLINKARRFSLKAKKLKTWCCPLFVRGTRFPKQSANIGFPSSTCIKKQHLNGPYNNNW